MKLSVFMLSSVCLIAAPGFGDPPEFEVAHQELVEMNRLEQKAFVEGECEELLDLLADGISFYVNGRKMTKDAVGIFCERIPRPFPGSGEEQTQVHAVSPNAGYVVKTMTFPGTPRVEVVTKIWSKGPDGWKMRHFQSTVTDLKPPPSR